MSNLSLLRQQARTDLESALGIAATPELRDLLRHATALAVDSFAEYAAALLTERMHASPMEPLDNDAAIGVPPDESCNTA